MPQRAVFVNHYNWQRYLGSFRIAEMEQEVVRNLNEAAQNMGSVVHTDSSASGMYASTDSEPEFDPQFNVHHHAWHPVWNGVDVIDLLLPGSEHESNYNSEQLGNWIPHSDASSLTSDQLDAVT